MVATPKVIKIALGRIVVDDAIQPRFKKSRDAIRRYTQVYRSDPRRLPPLTLARIGGRDDLILVDGFHRLAAARLAHRRDVPARIIEASNEAEVKWLAVEANIANGVPLTRVEKRVIFRRFVLAGRNVNADGTLMSSRELSRVLALCSHQTILTWMRDDFPKVYSRMTGEDAEELEESDEERDPLDELALEYVEWTQGEYLSAIRRAARDVSPERIASSVADIERKVATALKATSLEELLKVDAESTDF